MTATPTDEAEAGQEASKPGVDDDPALIAARLELELAKTALEKERLGLTEQSERAKLVKEMVPDLTTVAVEKDTSTATDQASAVAECLIQGAIFNLVDDIADSAIQVVNGLQTTATGPRTPPFTFFVTSDTAYRDDLAAHRDVQARLLRLQHAANEASPAPVEIPTEGTQPALLAFGPMSLAVAALNALPGAITVATRLLAHQYTTSAHTSGGPAGVDLHAAGAIISRVAADPQIRILVRRLQPARHADLEKSTLDFAEVLDGRLKEARSEARVAAVTAGVAVDRLEARRAQLRKRADDIHAAWRDKVGRSASSAGLSEDLALVKALEEAIEKGDPDSAETKRLARALDTVKKRIEAVLEKVAAGTGEMGTTELLAMVHDLDEEERLLGEVQADTKRAKAQADQRVVELDVIHSAGIEFLEALGAADSTGERLLDKALYGAALTQPGALVLYVRLLHAGADGIDVNKVGADRRNTVYGGTIEWALLDHDGITIGAGVRTQIGYQQADMSDPGKATLGLIVGASKPRVDLIHPSGADWQRTNR